MSVQNCDDYVFALSDECDEPRASLPFSPLSLVQILYIFFIFLINFCLLLLIFQSILFFLCAHSCTTDVMYIFSKSTFTRVSNHHHLGPYKAIHKEFLYFFFHFPYIHTEYVSVCRTYFFFFFWCKTFFFRLFFFLPIFYVVRFFSYSAL